MMLGEVAAVFNGKTPSKGEQRLSGFPVLKIKNVDDVGDFRGTFTSFVDPALARKYDDKIIRAGDILILNAAHNAEYVGTKMFFARGSVVGALATGEWLIIRPDPLLVDPDFLYFWSMSQEVKRRIGELVRGIHLYPRDVSEIPIDFPDLPEQQRIGILLEKAARLRRMRRYALKLAHSTIGSVFNKMFALRSWTRIEMGDLALQERGAFVNGPFGSNLLTRELQKTGVPVIYIRDISSGRFVRVSTDCVSGAKAEELSVCRVIPGDVLMSKVGDPPGVAAIYPQNHPPAIVTQDVVRIRVDPSKIAPEYMVSFFNSTLGHEIMRPIIVEGTRARFGLTAFKDLFIPVPPRDLQEKFSTVVKAAEIGIAQQAEALRQAEHLFETLLHDAFSPSLVAVAGQPF